MSSQTSRPSREARTVGIFNFIRRIGFPTTAETISALVTLVFLACILGFPRLGLDLPSILLLAVAVILLPALLGEAVASQVLLRDPVLDYRRLIGLELIAWAPSLLLFPLAGLLTFLGLQPSWQDMITLVLSISLPIRVLSFISLSATTIFRKLAGSLAVPVIVCLTMLLEDSLAAPSILASLTIASIVSILGFVRLVGGIEEEGTREVGAPPMALFRAFLNHWLNHDPGRLEELLAPLGLDDDIQITILSFFRRDSTHKGSLVVSSFHPGPYRDLGSGGLPSRLKKRLEEEFGGVVHVPHGISGHQSNILTSKDVEKFLGWVVSTFPRAPRTATASRLERGSNGIAKASGQLFDKTALVTLTLSPEDMEDMPQEIEGSIHRKAGSFGLNAAVVDAHNSMHVETMIGESQANQLRLAAEEALAKLVGSELHQSGFKAGFAQNPLADYALEDGIGPGGVSVLVVSNQEQKVAYLTIDGNNMEPGFREMILSSLEDMGIVDGEVMTTDTHLVTGLVRSPLGYYPVGAHIDKRLFIGQLRETVKKAVEDLEDVMLDISRSEVRVRVLGRQTFQTMTSYIRLVGVKVRNLFYLLESACILTTVLILVLL